MSAVSETSGPKTDSQRRSVAKERLRDRSRSIAAYRKAVLDDPNDLPTRFELATILHRVGDYLAALRELDYCLLRDRDNPEMLCTSGFVCLSMGNLDAAERFLRRAVELGCASAKAELNLGVLLTRKALWRDAVPHFRRSIELERNQPTAYICLGEALNCTDDLSGALSAFEKAQDIDPDNQRALRGLGVVYDRLGRPEEAVEMYHRSREGGVKQ